MKITDELRRKVRNQIDLKYQSDIDSIKEKMAEIRNALVLETTEDVRSACKNSYITELAFENVF